MKKFRDICFVACITIMSIFLLSACDNNSENTIQQQLLDEIQDNNLNVDKIIHLEVIKDGILVFYLNDNNLSEGFIKLEGARWEWNFGGGSLPLETEEGFNWSFTNFDDFFVRYGVITDNNIKRIKDEENNFAKIIQGEDGIRVYFFIDKSVVFDQETKRTNIHKLVPVYE